ncbi:MAG: ShlB/FhaC/HecB family hemolysin secretion/activation protein [Phycisphaeraceae bacterium]|nr:ShlB/FhaC/HecB family hemolysin secretion/activation protein [Phycisphaeraceae bacterium]
MRTVVAEEGPIYPVSAFVLRYAQETQGLPMIDELAMVEVDLGRVEDGYVAPREGTPVVRLRIGEVRDRGVERYYASAIAQVNRAILAEFSRRGIIAVLVSPSDEDIYQPADREDPEWGKDLRPFGKTEMGIIIRVGLVKDVRTVASGDRIPADARINNPLHARIIRNSPIQPAGPDPAVRRDIINRPELDDYIFRLNRFPARQVDASLAPATEPGGVVLDYLVSEKKPWVLWGQVSNTGTEETSEWVERIGFTDFQLTNNDDILSLIFSTASFQETYSFNGSYDAPLLGSDRYRWRVFGDWNTFTASDLGFADEKFKGDGWDAGGEITANVYQRGPLFIDVFGGARWQNYQVDNQLADIEGNDDFFIPRFGVRLDRYTQTANTNALIAFEFNLPGVAGTSTEEAQLLGRLDVDTDWLTLKWDVSQSVYLEPLLFPTAFAAGQSTLAHEIYGAFRGQYAFDYRLIPQEEQIIGGMYTVRGYPEAAVAGDTALIGNIEYRFHLPRALGLQPNPEATPLFGQPFRWTPQQPYGPADWDLVLSAFFDVGYAENSDIQPYESNETLMGAGIGAGFQFKNNLILRLDWGFALRDIPGTDAGDNRVNFSATILY